MLSFFPPDVLNEIWDLIESVSEGFPTYSWVMGTKALCVALLLTLFYLPLKFALPFFELLWIDDL